MRVLLISPLHDLDPPCGDITYTDILINNPPAGVIYETYADAIKRGALIEHGGRSRICKEPLLALTGKILNVARQRRWLFWEPFRFFSVKPGEYDLIHLHVFNARFFDLACPLVVSSGAPQKDLYLDRRHFSSNRVAWLERIEKLLSHKLRINHNSYFYPQSQRILVYTEHYRDQLIRNGYVDADRIDVVPIMSLRQSAEIVARPPKRIGFVARNFAEKGGEILLKAYQWVRKQQPNVELWIIGSPPELTKEQQASLCITWLNCVPRETLLREVLPSFDVFAYPTPHDCFSYVMLEAMSCGIAIATSDYVSMPEAVDYGRAGLTSPVSDVKGLAENILTLLDPETNFKFRQAARKRFEEHFSWDAVAPRILDNYQQAVEAYQSVTGSLPQ